MPVNQDLNHDPLAVGLITLLAISMQAWLGLRFATGLDQPLWLGALLGQLLIPTFVTVAYALGWIVIQLASLYEVDVL